MSCNFSRGQCVRLQPLWVSLPSYSVSQHSFIGNFCHYGDSSPRSPTAAHLGMGGSGHSLITQQLPATSLPDPLTAHCCPNPGAAQQRPSTAHPTAATRKAQASPWWHHRGLQSHPAGSAQRQSSRGPGGRGEAAL